MDSLVTLFDVTLLIDLRYVVALITRYVTLLRCCSVLIAICVVITPLLRCHDLRLRYHGDFTLPVYIYVTRCHVADLFTFLLPVRLHLITFDCPHVTVAVAFVDCDCRYVYVWTALPTLLPVDWVCYCRSVDLLF